MSNPVNTPASEQAKAILGGVLAGLTALGTALSDGVVSPVEWVGIMVAALATYGTVFGVRNQPANQRVNQRGHVDLAVVLLVGILVLLVLVATGHIG